MTDDMTVGDMCDAFLMAKRTDFEAEGCPVCNMCRFYEECKVMMQTKGVEI
jgi:hypothetical protein